MFKKYLCLLVTLVYSLPALASITAIKSINEIPFAQYQNADTLFILDVDETIMENPEPLSLYRGTPAVVRLWDKVIAEFAGQQLDLIDLRSIMYRDMSRRLIEPALVARVRELQSRNVPVIALTAMGTKSFGRIMTPVQDRQAILNAYGFSLSFHPNLVQHSFGRDHTTLGTPLFFKGVLATGQQPKGPVLLSYLSELRNLGVPLPKKVVMVDNERAFLRSVAESLRAVGIDDFVGYEYSGFTMVPYEECAMQVQVRHLLQHKQWIGIEVAREKCKPAEKPVPLDGVTGIKNPPSVPLI